MFWYILIAILYPSSALAASAPVLQFEGITPCESYNKIVTDTFARYGDNCVENIRRSWKILTDTFNSGGELKSLTPTY